MKACGKESGNTVYSSQAEWHLLVIPLSFCLSIKPARGLVKDLPPGSADDMGSGRFQITHTGRGLVITG